MYNLLVSGVVSGRVEDVAGGRQSVSASSAYLLVVGLQLLGGSVVYDGPNI